MDKLHPEALKAARTKRNWSQKQLAKEAGISSDQIGRWERSKEPRKIRTQSQEKLSKALRVPWEELTRMPVRDEILARFDDELGRVQLNIRVHRKVRNALQHVCLRYSLRPADVIKLAPLLFFIIAEKSLVHRQANLEAMEEQLGQLECDSSAVARHLAVGLNFRDSLVDEALNSEHQSISQRDILGKHVQLENSYQADPECSNPFVNYLNALMADIPIGLVDIDYFEWGGDIDYSFTDQTLQEATGIEGETYAEKTILDAITEGEVDLGTVLSRKNSLSQEEYRNWLEKAVETARGHGPAVKREAFNIAKGLVKNALREKGFELAGVEEDDIERLSLEAITNNSDIMKEAERRIEQRSKLLEIDPSIFSDGGDR